MGRSLSLRHRTRPGHGSFAGYPSLRRQQGARLRQPGLAGTSANFEDEQPVLHFCGDSDAHIVRGLVAILLAVVSGKPADQILAADPVALFERLGLREHLTPQRSNGFRSMVTRIRADAQQALASRAVSAK
jgi:SufE protein probably involved in Fe-S center assembly